MNRPPEEFVRVMPDTLHRFVEAGFLAANMRPEDAALMADLLVVTDLRGVFSHGTRMANHYVDMMLTGRVNPRPEIRVVTESPTTAVVDGDGGMGHLAAFRATGLAIAKCRAMGLGAATSRNHFHFGGAGKYTRMALEHDLIGIATSTHRFRPRPGGSIFAASGGSPFSIAIPSGEQPPIVIDMACNVDAREPLEQAFERIPATFFKMLGMAAACVVLGGFLPGIWQFDPEVNSDAWPAANQGALICAIDVTRFRPMEEFKAEVDRYVCEARGLQPAPGFDRAELPGGPEWVYEREWAQTGIPVGAHHRQELLALAERVGLDPPC